MGEIGNLKNENSESKVAVAVAEKLKDTKNIGWWYM